MALTESDLSDLLDALRAGEMTDTCGRAPEFAFCDQRKSRSAISESRVS